jgi:hypothetical protein
LPFRAKISRIAGVEKPEVEHVGSLEMRENAKPGFRDLTLDEVLKLLKHFFGGVFVCALIFVLPYLLLTSASEYADAIVGDKRASQWTGYVLSFVVLLWVVFHIDTLFSRLAELFANLANLTKEMSTIKRTAFAILLVLYFWGCVHFPNIGFFVSVLGLFPAGFTYDEYKRLLKDRLPKERDV